ncbi:unnamed protein product [Brassica oleracea]
MAPVLFISFPRLNLSAPLYISHESIIGYHINGLYFGEITCNQRNSELKVLNLLGFPNNLHSTGSICNDNEDASVALPQHSISPVDYIAPAHVVGGDGGHRSGVARHFSTS